MTRFATLASLVALTIFSTTQARADLLLTGTYDSPTTNANQVDVSATTDTGNQLSLTTFTTQVAAAFLAQAGGVVTFDQPGDAFTTSSPQNLHFADNTVLATVTRTNASTSLQTSGSNRTPVSGSAGYGGASSYGFTFDYNNHLTAVGLTVISRSGNGSGTATITATFVDAAGLNPETFNASDNLADSNAGDDTFFGFTAPAGKYLSGVTVVTPYFTWIDDLAVITEVPEPASVGLLSLGALLILKRTAAH